MAEPYEKLATALSVAVRIEPELIRAVRLAVFPRFDVSAEADLWFSPLVRSRGPHGIVFDQDVIVGLRAELSSWLRSAPAADPVHGLGDVLSSVHKRLSPALALEERVTWLAVTGREDAIDAELMPALKALVEENRGGIADWFVAAWHRLPPNARQSLTAWKLAQVVRPDLNVTAPSLGLVRMPGAGPDLTDIVPLLPDVRMLLRRNGDTLEVGDFDPTDDTVGILVPDTDPRLLTVGSDAVVVPRSAHRSVAVSPGPVRVTTARGAVYEVSDVERPSGTLLVVDVLNDDQARLQDALGADYEPTTLRNPTSDDVRAALDELRRFRREGPLVLYWRGPATKQNGWPLLLLNDSTPEVSYDEVLSSAISSGDAPVLIVLDVVMSHDVTNTRFSGFVEDIVPEYRWLGVVITTSSRSDEPMSTVLSSLLTSGPSSVEDQRRWSSAGEQITGFDVCRALSAETGNREFAFEANQATPQPMFRNPLYRAETRRAGPWFDVTAEVEIVLRWLDSGHGNVFVIAGGPDSGRTEVLDYARRQADPAPGTVVIEGLDSNTSPLDEIARMNAAGTRVLVTVDNGSPLLRELVPSGPDLDLDDVRAYARRRLTDVYPEAGAEEIAAHLVDTLKLSPALVRRTTMELEGRHDTSGAVKWQDRVLAALHAAFQRDLQDEPRSRVLLQALAWAHGGGFPEAEWLACARALASNVSPFTAEEARTALWKFGHYVTENLRGHRIAHVSLAKALRRDTSNPLLRQRIVVELSKLAPKTGPASAYLLSRLRDHVTEAGRAGLPPLRELATRDRSWLPDLGHAAYTLATRNEGPEVIDLAEEAATAYTEHVITRQRSLPELRGALNLLESCLRAAKRFTDADQVWPRALAEMPPNIAKWVDDSRKAAARSTTRTTTPKPVKPRGIRPHDLVVVVPGIKDNVLRDRRALSAPLPPDLGDDRPRGGPSSARLDTDGYARLLRLLNRLGYGESTRNLVTLPYDWRLSYRLSGRLLGEQVEDALATWRRRGDQDAKVVFLCVSTGGLPVRWYVERCGGAELTAGVITIGTPYQGSMRDLERLVNNTWERGTETLWRSFPSTYQRLPVYPCIERAGEQVLPTRVDLPGVDRHRIADGAAFLDGLLDAESARPDSLPATHTVVGGGHPTPVRARIARDRLQVYEPQAHRDPGSGDSYVPTFAAAHPSVPTNRIVTVTSTHDLLHRNYQVLDAIERILPAAARPRRR